MVFGGVHASAVYFVVVEVYTAVDGPVLSLAFEHVVVVSLEGCVEEGQCCYQNF